MAVERPTGLEAALLHAFYNLHGDEGFPAPSNVRVTARENTGGGRYVDLDSPSQIKFDSGRFDLKGGYIEMAGIPHGLMAVAEVKGHRLRQIEIAVYGGYFWNGDEREWKIVGIPGNEVLRGGRRKDRLMRLFRFGR